MPSRFYDRLIQSLKFSACLLLFAVATARSDAVIVNDNAPADAADPVKGADNTSGVYVRDSAVAVEKLSHAQRMESLKQWSTSADLYQEILQKYPDRVVPARVDDHNRIIQYTSVTQAVTRALCKWPVEGLDVYRARYETEAANLLKNAAPGDIAPLHKVLSLYFVTDSAKVAGVRLMDAYFELGDYAAVAQIGRRLLDWHPNLTVERPGIIYRVALSEQLCGDPASAQLGLKELQTRFPTAVGAVRGVDVVLADSLANELKTGNKVVRAATSDSWLTVGGDASRGKISSAQGKPGAKLYSIPLAHRPPSNDPNLNAFDQAQRKQGAMLGVMPVTDRGELFFQDNLHLYAVSLDSGLPLPGWAATYPSQNGIYTVPGNPVPMPAGQQFCITLTDKYVTAVMAIPDRLGENGDAIPEAQLVCLDRQTGRELWKNSVRYIPDEQGSIHQLRMGGAPLVVGDNVYVLARGGKGQQFEDCCVLCFDLNNGHPLWHSYLASAASQDVFVNPQQGVVVSDSVSPLAYASGRIFAITNLGAVASLDAYSGTINWLDIYRDANPQEQLNGMIMGRGFGGGGFINAQQQWGTQSTAPWVYNPAVVQDGKVFVLPFDSKNLFVYDADTGIEIKRIDLTDFDKSSADDVSLGVPETLLGVLGDNVVLGGPAGAWRIPWKAYNHDTNQMPDGFWHSTRLCAESQSVRGRGFVTADAVYIPTINSLFRLTMASGMIAADGGEFPKNHWDPVEQGPGNVLVTQEQVVIAGDKRVDVYTDLTLAYARLDRGVADAPTDPKPRLRYAEIMFVAGQSHIAQDKLAEALQLMSSPRGITAGPLRDRAFSDSLTFATKFADRGEPAAQINKMFDDAALTAQSPSQQVAYRIARAKYDLAEKDFADAVDYYQDILSDQAMRQVPLPDPENNFGSLAGVVAEKAIANLLAEPQANTAYEKYEKIAAGKLATARAANDPQQLLNVAQVYPNSQVARESMLTAADVFEAKGDLRMATQVLRRLLNQYHDLTTRIPALEAMARDYLKIPGRVDVAVARLAIAANFRPNAKLQKPLTLPDGTVLQDVTFRQAHDALTQYVAKLSTESLPLFNLPTKEEYRAYMKAHPGHRPDPFQPDLIVNNIGTLLKPLDGFERYDRIATFTAGAGVAVYPIGSAAAAGVCPTVNDNPANIAWLAGNPLVWSEGSLHLLKGDSGQAAWNVEVASLPTIEVNPDDASAAAVDAPQQIARPQNVRLRRQVIIRGNMGVRIIGPGVVAPGVVAVAPPEPPAAGGPEQVDQVRPVGDRIIVTTTAGRIFAIDSTEGQVVWQTRVSPHAVDHLVANDDFTVMRVTDEQSVRLIVLNSFSGDLIGRKSFFAGPGSLEYPLNLALSADGNLVYTMLDRVCVQDLNEANLGEHGMEPKASSAPANTNPPLFQGCDGPEQLIINQGRIFAVGENGKEVHVYDLETAQPATIPIAEANGEVPLLLATASSVTSPVGVAIRASGNYFYIRRPHGIIAYKLSQPPRSWESSPVENFEITGWLVGKDALLLTERRAVRLTETNQPDPRLTLCAYSRLPVPSHPSWEIGLLIENWEIANPAGISAIQPVAGGVVYLSGDGQLHTLLGAHDHLPQ